MTPLLVVIVLSQAPGLGLIEYWNFGKTWVPGNQEALERRVAAQILMKRGDAPGAAAALAQAHAISPGDGSLLIVRAYLLQDSPAMALAVLNEAERGFGLHAEASEARAAICARPDAKGACEEDKNERQRDAKVPHQPLDKNADDAVSQGKKPGFEPLAKPGVKECDAYIDRLEQCRASAPPGKRGAFEDEAGRVLRLGEGAATEDQYAAVGASCAASDAALGKSCKASIPKWAEDAVSVWDTTLALTEDNYRDAVVLHLHFENKAPVRVVGISTLVTVKNVFGKVVLKRSFDNEIVLEPGSKERNDDGWVFPDNKFANGEPYDLMWQMARDGTGTVDVRVTKVILAGGIVLKPRPAKKAP